MENELQSTEIQPIDLSFLDNAKKTQDFGAKTFSFYGKGGHEGTDFSANIGTPVRGYSGWVVDFAGQGESYYGNKVILRNPKTGESVEFAHLKDIGVKKGDVVRSGQVVATTGNSGYRPDGKTQQAHLHVNYYTPDNKKSDFLKAAKGAKNNFSLVPTFDSVFNDVVGKIKGGIVPKVQATDGKTSDSSTTPKKKELTWAEQQTALDGSVPLRNELNPTTPGAYVGKSQGSYQIKPGDTLGAIAKQFNTNVQEFQRQNPQIKDVNKIYSGQSLVVPSTVTETNKGDGYTIRSGDTLTSIARNLGTTVNDLVRKNGIQNPNLIRAGAKLKV